MGLERFMLYSAHAQNGRVSVVYCWGFRASQAVATKLSEWVGGLPVIKQDLDTLDEVRCEGAGQCAYRPAEGNPPVAPFLIARPEPVDGVKPRARGQRNRMIGEIDLRGGVTVWRAIQLSDVESPA